MKKIVLVMPLLALMSLTSCNNNKLDPKNPPKDTLSEYSKITNFSPKYVDKEYEERVTSSFNVKWKNHHIVEENGYLMQGDVLTPAKASYEYNGDDLVLEVREGFIRREDNVEVTETTYDQYHNITLKTIDIGNDGILDFYQKIKYTYDASGNILTSDESRYNNPREEGDPEYDISIHIQNTYDAQSRLTKTVQTVTNYGYDRSVIKGTTVNDYKGSFEEPVKTYFEEYDQTTKQFKLKRTTTTTLDNRGNPVEKIIDIDNEGKISKDKIVSTYDNNNFLSSRVRYDLLNGKSITGVFQITYHNNNYAQIETVNLSGFTPSDIEIEGISDGYTLNKYDERNRLIETVQTRYIENPPKRTTYSYSN